MNPASIMDDIARVYLVLLIAAFGIVSTMSLLSVIKWAFGWA